MVGIPNANDPEQENKRLRELLAQATIAGKK
jgi:hypothetical protein